jgi:hypothetical protein
MVPRQFGLLALCVGIAAVLVGGVMAYQRSQNEVLVDTPAVRIETNKATGETTVDAPFAHVEKDRNGTRVDAPNVKIDVPKRTTD